MTTLRADQVQLLESVIVELVEARNTHNANDYLEAGWVLLKVEAISMSATHPSGGEYVRRSLRYVVGRPAGVPRRDPSLAAQAAAPESRFDHELTASTESTERLATRLPEAL